MEKTISHTPKRTETKQIYCATEADTTGSFERRSHLRTAPTRQYVLTHSNTFRENKSRTNLYKQTHIHHIVFFIVSLCWYVVFICALTRAKPWRGKPTGTSGTRERERKKRMRLSEKYWPKKIIIHTSTRKNRIAFYNKLFVRRFCTRWSRACVEPLRMYMCAVCGSQLYSFHIHFAHTLSFIQSCSLSRSLNPFYSHFSNYGCSIFLCQCCPAVGFFCWSMVSLNL